MRQQYTIYKRINDSFVQSDSYFLSIWFLSFENILESLLLTWINFYLSMDK